MTLEDAFLLAILDDPADDFPRLAYADWLEERGDPRGEFIHVQCLLAAMPADDPGRPPLQQRERELLDRHQAEWLAALGPPACRGVFRRGFLDEVTISAAAYLADGPVRPAATVRRLEVDLTGFDVPAEVIEFVPESVARENVALPIGFRGRTLVLAMPEPLDAKRLAMFEFILNRPVDRVFAPAEQVIEAINRHYGQSETESVDSVLYEFVDLAPDPAARARPGRHSLSRRKRRRPSL